MAEAIVQDITRDSHYVPRRTLRRWAADGRHVLAYRTLVPHEDFPIWSRYAIKSFGTERDLYTAVEGGDEADSVEKWLTREYEEPGQDAIERLIERRRMVPDDWKRIARFVALQQLRTPLNFLETTRRYETQLTESLEKVVRDLEEAGKAGQVLPVPTPESNFLADQMRIKVTPDTSEGTAFVAAQVSSSRAIWLATIRHHLIKNVPAICQHRWRAILPAGDAEWPLTDHPVLTLNYDSPERYDFRGGWGHEGTELIMPISPRVAVYTQVKRKDRGFEPSVDQTAMLQRLMCERAFRWVIARQPLPWLSTTFPREVDAARFKEEEHAWDSWNAIHSAAEREFGA